MTSTLNLFIPEWISVESQLLFSLILQNIKRRGAIIINNRKNYFVLFFKSSSISLALSEVRTTLLQSLLVFVFLCMCSSFSVGKPKISTLTIWWISIVEKSQVFSIGVCLQLASMNARMEKKRVVIIGAGVSGIAAATRLYENGVKDIIVLEADETRIGGRIHTVEVRNERIEMGAQWIHGEEENVVYQLSLVRNLTCVSYDPTKRYIYAGVNLPFARSAGELIEPDLVHRMIGIRNSVLANPGENVTSFENCGQFYVHLLQTELSKRENVDIPEDVKSEFIELCHQTKNTDVASETWFDLSVSTFNEYKLCKGNQAIRWCEVGYRKLFSILMSDVIALNTTVERISFNNDDRNTSVIVQCSNGRKINADHVVITISLGALKATYTKLFENGTLSKLKIQTIENLEFGTVDKVFIEFERRWWPDDVVGFYLLWTKNDRNEYIERGLGWVIGMYAVAVVDFAENFLCGWISGANARIMESLDDEVIRDTVVQVLKRFLSKMWTIPKPVRIIKSTWYSNHYFGGSYSYRSPRTDAANVSSHTLSIPVNNGRDTPVILFAGEATSRHHYSTVHGAVESGWREADRLVKFFTNFGENFN